MIINGNSIVTTSTCLSADNVLHEKRLKCLSDFFLFYMDEVDNSLIVQNYIITYVLIFNFIIKILTSDFLSEAHLDIKKCVLYGTLAL